MMTNKVGDVGPILLVGPAILQDYVTQTGDMDQALSKTWADIQESQQSYATKDRSVASRRGGDIAKALTMFTSTPGQYLSFEIGATKALAREIQRVGWSEAMKSRKARALANTLFINHVLLPGGFFTVSTILSNLFRGDEWDEDDTNGLILAMLTGPASAWVVAAFLTNAFINTAMTGKAKFSRGMVPLEGLKTDIEVLARVVNHGVNMDWEEAWEDAIDAASRISSPTSRAKQVADQILGDK